MKKLRTYSSPSFKFVEVLTEHHNCDITRISQRPIAVGGGGDEGGAYDADAAIFRQGIWDEDIEH